MKYFEDIAAGEVFTDADGYKLMKLGHVACLNKHAKVNDYVNCVLLEDREPQYTGDLFFCNWNEGCEEVTNGE